MSGGRFIYVFDMRAKWVNGASKRVMAVYARAAQHHSALVLHIPKQSLVKTIGFAALRTISEGDDRQVGRRAWIEPVALLPAGLQIACKRSEVSRVGKASVSSCRSGGERNH